MKQCKCGFTLIEVMVIVTIFSLLAGFATINLLRPQTQSSLETTVVTLIADLKSAQLKSMIGDSDGLGSAQTHGIFFDSSGYTLFRGTYSPSEPSNFEIMASDNITLSTTFPSTQVVFSRRSGEIAGFSTNLNTITVSHQTSGESKTITVNRYGVVSVN